MLTNYAKVATRNLLKSKAYSLVNILGLAIGIGSVLLISLFTAQELSYDSHFADSERIYRVALERIYPNRERLFASSSGVEDRRAHVVERAGVLWPAPEDGHARDPRGLLEQPPEQCDAGYVVVVPPPSVLGDGSR